MPSEDVFVRSVVSCEKFSLLAPRGPEELEGVFPGGVLGGVCSAGRAGPSGGEHCFPIGRAAFFRGTGRTFVAGRGRRLSDPPVFRRRCLCRDLSLIHI